MAFKSAINHYFYKTPILDVYLNLLDSSGSAFSFS